MTQPYAKNTAPAVTYILLERRPVHHATLEEAEAVREAAARHTGKKPHLMKVINVPAPSLRTHRLQLVKKGDQA